MAIEADKVSTPEYDLVVIGSGPAGQKCAIAAAKARKRVAVIDRMGMIGGVSVHTGTVPSKTVREAIFQLSGLAANPLYGDGSRSHADMPCDRRDPPRRPVEDRWAWRKARCGRQVVNVVGRVTCPR